MKKLDHHLYKNKGWYYLRYKKYRPALGTQDVKVARDERDYLIQYIKQNGRLPYESEKNEILFGEIAVKWSKLKKPKVSPTTWDRYKGNLNKFILPVFGNKAIDQITTLDVDTWVTSLIKYDFTKKTNKNIFSPLANIFAFAKKHKFISENPCDDADPIEGRDSVEKQPLGFDEIKIFLDQVSDFYRPLFTTMFFSGLRVAEMCGLQWKHIDLVNGIIKVRQNLVWLRGKMYLKEPKNQSSRRDVMVGKVVVDELRTQRNQTWHGDQNNFVFVNKEGECLKATTLAVDVFKHTLKRAGLNANRSLKDTRSSYITNALDAKERLSFIQKQVGHSTPDMIIRHYYKDIPSPDDGRRFEEKCHKNVIGDSDIVTEVLQRMFENPDKKRG